MTRKRKPQQFATRKGLCVAADRFRQVVAILRADYDLTPEIQAAIDALTLRLENHHAN